MARPSFARPAARYKPQATVLVICEDSKSCKSYLEDAAQEARANVAVDIIHTGFTDPLNIVKEAIKRQTKFDQVFCVIDRDTHEKFADALQLAKDKPKITLTVSYPCFEFWLLLHFVHTRKPYHGNGRKSPAKLLIDDLRTQPGMQDYDKARSIFADLGPAKLQQARTHSPRVLTAAQNSGEYNPSTTLHLLLDYFDELGAPQPLL